MVDGYAGALAWLITQRKSSPGEFHQCASMMITLIEVTMIQPRFQGLT